MIFTTRTYTLLGALLTIACVSFAVFTRTGGTENASGAQEASAEALSRAAALASRAPFVGPDAADADPNKRLLGRAIVDAAERAAAETPFPAEVDNSWAGKFEGGISPEGVVRITEVRAACAWAIEALNAATPEARDRAANVLAEVRKWPAFAASPLGDGPRAAAAAAAASDRPGLQRYAQGCS